MRKITFINSLDQWIIFWRQANMLELSIRSDARDVKSSASHPHFEYPQFKQVWHPSISTSAWVLHFAHIVAPGGKPEDSVSVEAVAAEAAPTGAALTSAFFFAPACS
jgi:hypothetical protein